VESLKLSGDPQKQADNGGLSLKFFKWRFEFAEMVGGKTVVFVYHLKHLLAFCEGPNAFFVLRK
jgi:hypothetical protein